MLAELLLANNPTSMLGRYRVDAQLHSAAEEGRKDVVELLLAHGANVNARSIVQSVTKGNLSYETPEGLTPLHLAANMGHEDVAEVLLAHGAIEC